MSLENKVILTVAPVGSDTAKSSTPYLPTTPKEVAQDVYACWKAGASMAHIHVRDDEGVGVMDTAKFAETVKHIRETDCNIVLNLTTSGAICKNPEDRYRHVIALKPEMCSYDCGSMNFGDDVFENSPQFLAELGGIAQQNNVKPEIECFDAGMVYNAIRLAKKGVLKTPMHFQFVLGVPGGMTATIENLVFLKNLLPEGSTWSTVCMGKYHLELLFATIAMGGNIRVGLEDSIYYSKGVLATNVQYVERAIRIIHEFNKEVATPDEAREILGLKK